MQDQRLTNNSGKGKSPHFYRTGDPSALLVQGEQISDPGFTPPAGEEVVEVPTVLAIDAICHLAGDVTLDDLGRLLRLFAVDAFRLETLPVYLEEDEQPLLEHWRATGEIIFDTGDDEWKQMVIGHLAAGRRMRRVHLLRQPLSDYLRWEFAFQCQVGEDIRVVDLDEHPELTDHPHDFWLFDNRVGVSMDYDADGRLAHCERIGESDIERFRLWRDGTWRAGRPLPEFLNRVEAA